MSNTGDAINVRGFGATGEGLRDETAALQAAINAMPEEGGRVVVPAGTYLIDPSVSLRLRSGLWLDLSPAALLMSLPMVASGGILKVQRARDVRVTGGILDGRRADIVTSRCFKAYGARVIASESVLLFGVSMRNCSTDGLYIGGVDDPAAPVPSRDVRVQQCTFSGNRRQGISVTHAQGVHIERCSMALTAGAPPGCGIDVEPNRRMTVRDVRILDSTFEGNEGYGVLLAGHAGRLENVEVRGNVTRGNHMGGIRVIDMRGALVVANRLEESFPETLHVDTTSANVGIEANTFPGGGGTFLDPAPPPVVPPPPPVGSCNG